MKWKGRRGSDNVIDSRGKRVVVIASNDPAEFALGRDTLALA